jgi:hypothetical protein
LIADTSPTNMCEVSLKNIYINRVEYNVYEMFVSTITGLLEKADSPRNLTMPTHTCTHSYARLTFIVSIMIVTLRHIDMRTRWNSHTLLGT